MYSLSRTINLIKATQAISYVRDFRRRLTFQVLTYSVRVAFTILLCLSHANASELTVERENIEEINKIKSAYVYNFLKYIDFSDKKELSQSPFHVCILGEDPINEVLSEMDGRLAKDAKVQVTHKQSTESITECHILYIGKSMAPELPSILRTIHQQPVLTVSEIIKFTQQGGMIEFNTSGSKIGITINLKNVNDASIKISALLLEVAKLVDS